MTASQREVWRQTVWKSLRNSRGTSRDQLGCANPPGSWCWCTAQQQQPACKASSKLTSGHCCSGTHEAVNSWGHSSPRHNFPRLSCARCLSQSVRATCPKASFYSIFLSVQKTRQHVIYRTRNPLAPLSSGVTDRDPVWAAGLMHCCKTWYFDVGGFAWVEILNCISLL